MTQLLATLTARGGRIGVATNLRKADVEAAQIFPPSHRSPRRLSPDQLGLLLLFAGTAT
jgi:hypothetical protein